MDQGSWRPSEQALGAIVEGMADAVAVVDRDGVLRYANPAAERLIGHRLEDRQGRDLFDLIHPDDLDLAAGSLAEMAHLDVPGAPIEVRVRAADGRWAHVEVIATNLLGRDGVDGLVLSIRDITARRSDERARVAAERVLDHTFAHNPVGLVLCRTDGRFVKVNPAFCEILGLTEAELLADTYQGLTPPEEYEAEESSLLELLRGQRASFTTDKHIVRKDGSRAVGELTVSMVEDDDGVRLVFGQLRDVTEQREMQRTLEHRSLHDPLTGLANRALFADRVALAHRRHLRFGKGLSVAFVDLDDFKTVNDALGHAAGDELLRRVAERLTTRFRATDTVARVGGDEFAVLLDEASSIADAETLAAEIVELFEEPFEIAGRRLRVGASVGIAPMATGRDDARDVEELVADADLAMYAAKQAGKGRWRAFRPSMRSRAAASLDIREQLEHGFRTEAVEVHYQPVVDTATGQPVGMEALARWRHPTLGLLRPGDFLDVAEEMGLASALDWCVMERVALDRQTWKLESPRLAELPVSVNITVAESGPELEERIAKFLASPGGEGARLHLELTERAMLLNADSVAPTLERLKAGGIGLALDDFGVGYSSLAHLHRLPVSIVKLDRAFLASVQTAGSDFMAAVVELCEALDLNVVAEGVETYDQHQVITGVGIRYAQGFFYAEPRGPRALASLLQPAPPEQVVPGSGEVSARR
ncbi:MAG TPA: EAL domain-containing protein [Acidimicrobiales bacterium]|nr:EAL domain-containing protein [Acidimicrobiales bacterium]